MQCSGRTCLSNLTNSIGTSHEQVDCLKCRLSITILGLNEDCFINTFRKRILRLKWCLLICKACIIYTCGKLTVHSGNERTTHRTDMLFNLSNECVFSWKEAVQLTDRSIGCRLRHSLLLASHLLPGSSAYLNVQLQRLLTLTHSWSNILSFKRNFETKG